MKNRIFFLCITFLFPVYLYATWGGPDSIEILGFDKQDAKIYYLLRSGDESGSLPQLYFFRVEQDTVPVVVDSIYQGMNRKDTASLHDERELEKRLGLIKRRLIPLTPLSTQHISLGTKVEKQAELAISDDFKVTSWTMEVTVVADAWQGKVEITNYRIAYDVTDADPPVTLRGLYQIPSLNTVLGIIRYVGKPNETFYTTDECVLLHPKIRDTTAQPGGPADAATGGPRR